jgi:uncharacterized protein YvpB
MNNKTWFVGVITAESSKISVVETKSSTPPDRNHTANTAPTLPAATPFGTGFAPSLAIFVLLVTACVPLDNQRPIPGTPSFELSPRVDDPRESEPEDKVTIQSAPESQEEKGDDSPSPNAPTSPTPKPEGTPTTPVPSMAAPSVQFVQPTAGSSVNPVTFMVLTTGPIDRVRYKVKAVYSNNYWTLGENSNPNNSFAFTHDFDTVGHRELVAEGLSQWGEVLAADTRVVDLQNNVPQQAPAPASTPACQPDYVLDCVGNCAKSVWIGDGFCDDGSQYDIVLTCPEYNNDGGDCDQVTPPASTPACQPDYVLDCVGNCAKSIWIGDGFCDDGSQYNIVLTCLEYNNDGGDCDQVPAPTNNNTLPASVPYFYQYSNTLHPGASCQNTSLAMVLKYYGWNGTPDTITSAWGKNYAQTPAGLATVFNDYAASIGIPQRLTPHTSGNIEGLKALLATGTPVIIHGFFTSSGHVMVVTGYQNGQYVLNDPAGKWNQNFKGGYPYGWSTTIGHGISYPAAAFEAAVATSNGSSFLPLWYHEVVE